MFRISSSTTKEDLLKFLSGIKHLEETQISCSGCNTTLHRTRKSILGSFTKTGLLFCSMVCRNDYYGISRVYRDVTCAECGTSFSKAEREMTGDNDFCSRSCAATFNNRLYPKREKTAVTHDTCDCGNEKLISSSTCKACHYKNLSLNSQSPEERAESNKKAVVSYRQRMKQRAIEYKGGKCVVCGYNRCIRSLQFHHLDPSEKDFNLAAVTRKWERVKPELDKCILVCANCHGEIHHGMHPEILSL